MIIIPDMVFFKPKDYEIFVNGQLKIGSKFTIGENSSSTLVMEVTNVFQDYYECINNRGVLTIIDWDLDKFNNKRRQHEQTRWSFYNIISYGN